jgi:class 3 adenylate cyclase
LTDSPDLPPNVDCALLFHIAPQISGILGLGAKLIGEPYNKDDEELLLTLANNLVIALRNAKSFENIKQLNVELKEKNEQLEKALKELRAALRKVEILEAIKTNLSKFVPMTVTKIIETSPATDCLEAKERDISVMFLDIEGYTAITERLGAMEVNNLVERCFSVFMDAIYENNGDVVETSGDGLMVLFLSDDEKTNAIEAVRSALLIRDKTTDLKETSEALSRPLTINIGISSGISMVGANKFECYTGSRWTYTTHGTPINVAARICGKARGGAIFVSEETVKRVERYFSFTHLGKFPLKNLSEEVEIFALEDQRS